MKTSLIIEPHLFKEAKKAAQKQNTTISQVISHWARVGRETLLKLKSKKKGVLPEADLGGGAQIDINCRKEWMENLE